MAVDRIFRSTEKCQKIQSTDYETFNQLKKHNFDQVNFVQTTPCQKIAAQVIETVLGCNLKKRIQCKHMIMN